MVTRQQALANGYIVNIMSKPFLVDMTKCLRARILVNGHEAELPIIADGMFNEIESRIPKHLKVSQLPYTITDMLSRWKNWPKYKTGPVCGYVEFKAVIYADNNTPAILLMEKGEK